MGAGILIIAAVTWSRINGPYEGFVLVVFDQDHGLTLADLPSIAAVVVAAALVWPRRAVEGLRLNQPRGGDRAHCGRGSRGTASGWRIHRPAAGVKATWRRGARGQRGSRRSGSGNGGNADH